MLCSVLLLLFGVSFEIGSGGREKVYEVALVPETSGIVQNFTTTATTVGETDCSGFLCSSGECIRASEFCNGREDCRDGSDEIKTDGNLTNVSGIACRQHFDPGWWDSIRRLCILPHNQAYKEHLLCTRTNCSDGFLCRNQRCIDWRFFCDDGDDCKDGSDEIRADGKITNESGIACRQYFDDEFWDSSPQLCILPHNQKSKSQLICTRTNCSDGFLCRNQRCVHSSLFCDNHDDCIDGSDEIRADGKTTNESGIVCRQYFDRSRDSSPRLCILPQSQESKSQQICKIKTDCNDGFMCGNGLCADPNIVCGGDGKCGYDDDWTLELSNRGDRYCAVIYSSLTCLPPQKHVCDGTSYCDGGVDECLCGNGESQVFLDEKCFRCLRNRTTVIPLGQLCDGIFDCPDFTDECLCNDGERPLLCDAVEWEEQSVDPLEINCTGNVTTLGMKQICDKKNDCENRIDEENCTRDSNLATNPSKISNVSTYYCGYSRKNVTACDRIPECYDMLYEEECSSCSNRPRFCDHLEWNIGSLLLRCPSRADGLYQSTEICNGKSDCQSNVDESSCGNWFYCENETDGFERFTWDKVCDTVEDCKDGSDEGTYQNCSYFTCEVGSNVKYLDNRQVCDGTPDCVEGSDECQDHCIKSVFSDIESMIKNKGVVGFVWIISIAAVFGNIAVICLTTYVLNKERNDSQVEKSAVINKTLILNLSVSDLLVGIYTLAIVIKNSFNERYCLIDQEWRSSLTCSAIASLLVIGSQQSVFTMVIITVFRTLGITSRHKFDPSYKKFGLVVVVSWIVSVFLALIPLMPHLEDHFIDSVWYHDNKLFSTINQTRVENLTKWLALIHEDTNITVSNIGSWATLDILISELHPNLTVQRKFGFYSTHAVCLPTFFPNRKTDTAWWYSVLIISINFVSFVVVFVGSVIIYRSATAPNMALGEDVRQKRAARMQAKLSRIVVTDFCCWIPVCIMGFVQLSGVDIPHDAYIPIALFVIPINSSLNPFLYSNVPDKLWEKIKSFYALKCRRPYAPGAQGNRDNVPNDNVIEMRNL